MSIISAGTSSGTSVVVTGNTDGSLVFKTNNTGSGGTTALTLGADQSVTFGTEGVSAFAGNKNLLTNGSAMIYQRQASSNQSSTISTGFGPDCWRANGGANGVINIAQETTTLPEGYATGIGVSIITADSTRVATVYYQLTQTIGYLDFAHMRWGTSSALPATLSFWVRSSVVGTYAGSIQDKSASYSYPFTYTISAANTYEKKSITITPPTTVGNFGSIDTDGAVRVNFDFGSGDNYNGVANGTWQAGNYSRTSGSMSNWMTSVLNNFYITGIQFERGTAATSFEQRSFQQELLRSMRCFQKSFLYTTAPAQSAGISGATIFTQVVGASTAQNGMYVKYPVRMISAPTTLTLYSPLAAVAAVRNLTVAADYTSVTTNNSTNEGFYISGTSNVGSAAGNALGVHWSAVSVYT